MQETTCKVGDLGLIPGLEDPLEKEMATHSSILAWEIPWTDESGGLQSMGSQRVRHNLTTKSPPLFNINILPTFSASCLHCLPHFQTLQTPTHRKFDIPFSYVA